MFLIVYLKMSNLDEDYDFGFLRNLLMDEDDDKNSSNDLKRKLDELNSSFVISKDYDGDGLKKKFQKLKRKCRVEIIKYKRILLREKKNIMILNGEFIKNKTNIIKKFYHPNKNVNLRGKNGRYIKKPIFIPITQLDK